MKKLIIATAVLAFGAAIALSATNYSNNVEVAQAAEGDDIFCDLHYLRYKGNYYSEQEGYVSFKSSEELRTFYNDYMDSDYSSRFGWFQVTLRKPGSVLYPESSEFTLNANNFAFTLTDRFGNPKTNFNVGEYSDTTHKGTQVVKFINANISSTYRWNVFYNGFLELSRSTIDGGGATINTPLVNIKKGSCLYLDNSYIQNFNLPGDNTRLVYVNGIDSYIYYDNVIKGVGDSGFSGIRTSYGSPFKVSDYVTFTGLSFKNCYCPMSGGAITVEHGYVCNSSFIECESGEHGGALYITDSSSIVNCTFKDCYSGEDGGAVYIKGNNISVSDCKFYDNVSHVDGGAICVKGDDAKISECKFYENYANDDGGAIYVCTSGDRTIINGCYFEDNEADDSCDDIDGCRDTIVNGARYGATISDGNLFIIIEVSTILIFVAIILVILFKKKKVVAKDAQ